MIHFVKIKGDRHESKRLCRFDRSVGGKLLGVNAPMTAGDAERQGCPQPRHSRSRCSWDANADQRFPSGWNTSSVTVCTHLFVDIPEMTGTNGCWSRPKI